MPRNAFRMSVTKDNIVFASAHFITFPGHRCEALHGHNYRTRVTIEGALDPEAHFIFDFGALKQMMREITEDLDHRVLLPLQNPKLRIAEQDGGVTVAYEGQERYRFPKGDCALLPIPNTTVEMLAQYFAERLRAALGRSAGQAVRLDAMEIEVEETFGQSATYRESFA